MAIKNLQRIFSPRSIAVIGASASVGKVGNTVIRNLKEAGFEGTIFPVNPKSDFVEGLPTCSSVKALPNPVDLAILCTPASSVPELVLQCGEAGIMGLVILTAGFREMNASGAELERQLIQAASNFPEMRIVGPNCLGVLAPHARLNASFASAMPQAGSVAFISQSGALCTSILDWSRQENIGFSHFVSVGNMVDVGFADLIDYFSMDTHTTSIVMYIESIAKPREFLSAARAFAAKKPIIVYKAGRFRESAAAAASHTGAMAGVDAVYEAAFARAGIVRVFDLKDIFDCAELLSKRKDRIGSRLAIVTNAGGPGVMATDALIEEHGELAKLAPTTIEQLNEVLPPAWSHGNPVDLLGDATPQRLRLGLDLVLEDEGVDAALVILSPQAMTNPLECARALVETSQRLSKPMITSWMGGPAMRTSIELLNASQIPTYSTPEEAIRAFMQLVRHQRIREKLYETPRAVPVDYSIDRSSAQAILSSQGDQTLLQETHSKAILSAYGIPVVETVIARTEEEATALATRLGYPVALKIYSPDISHKTDVGGVELNLATPDAVANAMHRVIQKASQLRPNANIEGVTLQKMISPAGGCELILGAKRDPVFGPVLMVGSGGIAAEVVQDRALELPPLSESLARKMLSSLRIWPILAGFRGRPGVHIDRLIEILIRLSYLVADCPQIQELDINPLLANAEGVLALDARILLNAQPALPEQRPYSHLAIRPYPEEFVSCERTRGGVDVRLRPIKPEDEPKWHGLLASCSQESIHKRFRYLFKSSTHEMATRFCFVDYDREMNVVAELIADGDPALVAFASLSADLDHQSAEYAVLVGDAWQGRGLGSSITDKCIDICRRWGIRKVTAEVAADNTRMIRMFSHRGFQLRPSPTNESELLAEAQLDEHAYP